MSTPARLFPQLAVILLRFDMVLVVQENKVKNEPPLQCGEKGSVSFCLDLGID
jgi:hypothetical protein